MIAAVRVVLPWSTWPIVPMLTCGLVLSNFSLAIVLRYYFELLVFTFLEERIIGADGGI